MYIFGMIVCTSLYTAMFFAKSLNFMIVVLFCFGAMRSFSLTLAYVYLIELMPKEY